MKALRNGIIAAGSGLAVLVFGMGILPMRGTAQWLVFDGAQAVNALLQIEKAISQIEQAEMLYSNAENTYNQILTNAKMVGSRAGWQWLVPARIVPSSSNYFQTASGWITAINSGSNPSSGFGAATPRISGLSSTLWNGYPSDIKNSYGLSAGFTEIQDGLGQNALATTGRYRAQSGNVDSSVSSLERVSLSLAPENNTETGLLNQLTASQILNLRIQEEALSMNAANLDLQTAALTVERNRQVEQINYSLSSQEAMKAIRAHDDAGSLAGIMSFWNQP